ncbi:MULTISPECIES: hypothetical protein [Burkholderia]|uniref:hypothetical protein n=1 Tax=Burkholderia TaxID=32008 RepID=UPI0011A7B746|nr:MULTISPECIES: hypothetical protein [Burkholderia]MDN7739997.1 hypothetical protein [Burkholderia gladioli]
MLEAERAPRQDGDRLDGRIVEGLAQHLAAGKAGRPRQQEFHIGTSDARKNAIMAGEPRPASPNGIACRLPASIAIVIRDTGLASASES